MRRSGFTLIEIVIVTAAVGLIMVAMVGVILSTFKSQNQSKVDTQISQNGTWILSELRRNILGSSSTRIACVNNAGVLSVGLTNLVDNISTILSCDLRGGVNKIASTSGDPKNKTVFLSGTEVTVDCGDSFVTCDTLPSLEVSAVNFNFMLKSDVVGVGASKNFTLKVTIRN
jgi:prepilin-type N-terminal cleavage/methylation domain-containing protein